VDGKDDLLGDMVVFWLFCYRIKMDVEEGEKRRSGAEKGKIEVKIGA